MFDRNEPFFLLGGYDLEMVEIRHLLENNGYAEGEHFLDKKLRWGAKLSEYREDFKEERINVCIELTEDIEPPERYLRIDHHNELTESPSSLEQIAELLGVELSHYQVLVAANDRGYIPAMKLMGATKAEIEKVRRADRKAQGVTERDEQLAEESIAKHLSWENGIAVIHALTPKFSSITDRMYGKVEKLLIHTDTKLNYYGKGKEKLVAHFQELIEEGKAYYGGGENGFFGIAESVMTKKEIEESVNFILKVLHN